MIHIQVMRDSSEVIFYNTSELPVKIIRPRLSDYPNRRVVCHWHDDIELIYIVKNQMNYEINGKKLVLPEGSFLFVNARQLHYGFSDSTEDCEFICVLFHPSVLRGNAGIFQRMAEPVSSNESVEYLLLEECESADYRQAVECMKEMAALRERAPSGYEWEVLAGLSRIWSVIFRSCEGITAGQENVSHADRQIQRDMVSFIFSHYTDPLTLGEIAASGNVSRSKCCLIFKKYLGESPIDFVNAYRLEKSCLALVNTSGSITQIALDCGFNNPSYFTKMFSKKYGCTPSEYRKKKIQ